MSAAIISRGPATIRTSPTQTAQTVRQIFTGAGNACSLVKEQAQLRLQSAMAAPERKILRKAVWEAALTDNLSALRKSETDLKTKPRKRPWKLDLALKLRSETSSSLAGLVERLDLGKASTARGHLHLWSHARN